MNFEKEIFEINSQEEFKRVALEIFRFQARECLAYKEYISLVGIDPQSVHTIEQIPFLPIELYKTHTIYIGNNKEELLFKSSGTTGTVQSKHFVAKAQLYVDAFSKGFAQFYSPIEQSAIYALLPNYIENPNSSLLYMINNMVGEAHYGEFFKKNYDELFQQLQQRDTSRHTLLFGVSFALLDMAERYKIDLSQRVTIMETGGMKGQREEITREELHRKLRDSFGVEKIHSEYGMCECLSQSYSDGDGVFHSPKWKKIIIRDLNNPFKHLGLGARGGVNIIDLANIYSCSFIQTQDVGLALTDSSFTIEGRIDRSDIRGCNLLIEG